ncbi:MAG: Wzz/FepE/Etk N-terminal domain-containing protein, partial [Actinomycetota bacterium]|nr:Wzz/FepE/Etk N-terminal domain-containing protein [Actinomycetota bacterium]
MVTTVGQSPQREAPGVVLSLARYWRTSLLIVVVFAVAAFGVSLLLPKRYAATATINLTDPRFRDIFSRQGALPQDLERFTTTQADLLTSRRVYVEVTERVEGVTVGQLFRNISASAEREGAIDVQAEAGSAERARDLATATAQAYGRVTAEETRQRTGEAVIAIQANRQDLLSTIAEIRSGLEDGDEGVSRTQLDSVTRVVAGLDQRISEIRINADAFGDGIDYLEEARRPRRPVQPDPVRNAATGGLFGLLAAGALAWFRADRHRAADESASAEAVLGTPMLGSIPELRSDADLAGVTDASSVAAESYQFVTASLQYVFKWGVLLVTSGGRR